MQIRSDPGDPVTVVKKDNSENRGGNGDNECLGVGEANILDRHADHPPCDEQRVFAGIEHTREIVESRVGVRSTHRFMQRADQIVMALLRLIIDRRPPLHDRDQHGRIEDFPRVGGAPRLFGEAQGGAAIAIGHPYQA